MRFLVDIFYLGALNLRRHLLRSTLTSLGIILGVAAVIVMVSIGEGRKQQAIQEIQSLGATNIIIRSVRPADIKNSMGMQRRIAKFGITNRDYRRINHWSQDGNIIVPLKRVGSEVSCGSKRVLSQSYGTTPNFLNAAGLEISQGRYINEVDMRTKSSIVILGHYIAEQLFPLKNPLGEYLRIDSKILQVVGVLKPVGLAGGSGSALVGRDLNLDIHLPLTTARLEFGDQIIQRQAGSFNGEETELTEIYVVSPTVAEVRSHANHLRKIINLDHALKGDVQVIVPNELLENVRKTTLAMNILLISIAAISLIVGGIGIMNIMLASVVERTREIGIRRALGATRRDIIGQFVVETGSISTIGGLIGIFLGVSVSLSLEYLVPFFVAEFSMEGLFESKYNFETIVTSWSIFVSFFVATSTGLLFGIYPAVLASRQDPIVALRHD